MFVRIRSIKYICARHWWCWQTILSILPDYSLFSLHITDFMMALYDFLQVNHIHRRLIISYRRRILTSSFWYYSICMCDWAILLKENFLKSEFSYSHKYITDHVGNSFRLRNHLIFYTFLLTSPAVTSWLIWPTIKIMSAQYLTLIQLNKKVHLLYSKITCESLKAFFLQSIDLNFIWPIDDTDHDHDDGFRKIKVQQKAWWESRNRAQLCIMGFENCIGYVRRRMYWSSTDNKCNITINAHKWLC